MFPLDARVYRRTAVRRRDLMVCGCVREGRPSEAKARYGGIPNGTIGRGCGKNSAHPGKSTTGAEAHTDSLSLTWPCAGRFSTGSEAVPFPVGCTSRALQWCRLKVRGRDGHAIAGRMAALRAGRSPADRRGRLSPHNLLSLHSIATVRALQCPYGNLSSRGGCRSRPWRGPGGGRGRIGLR
jgi:hypothetical protein